MNKFWYVLKFEILSNFKNKVFIVSTAIILALIIIAINIPSFINIFDSIMGEQKKDLQKVIVFDEHDRYSDEDLKEYLGDVELTKTSNKDEIKDSVENKDFKLGIIFGDKEFTIVKKSDNLTDFLSVAKISELVKKNLQKEFLLQNNFTNDDVENFYNLEVKENIVLVGKDISQTFWVGYILLFVLYMSIVLYGQGILMSVVTEKSTKTMELLITSVSSNQLIFGKVFGAAIVALFQLFLILGSAFIGFIINKSNWESFSAGTSEILSMTINPKLLLIALIFFLVGFFVYSFMYAAFGSTVSRIEEANSVATLPVMLLVAAFLIAMLSMSNPNSTLAKVTSYVPFLSPFVMFMRISVTNINTINIIIALIINILTILFVGLLSAKIYRAGVLMYGKQPSLINIIKMVFSKS